MKRIGWIVVHTARFGGIVYNEQVRKVLGDTFEVEIIDATSRYFQKFRYLKIPESLFRLAQLRGTKDVWIRDFYSTLTLPIDKTKGKQVAVIHHVFDFSGFPLFTYPLVFVLKKIFYHNLKKVDAIVVVSQFWKDHFVQKGYSHVHVLYNGFDLSDFQIEERQVEEFKQRFHLTGKPIIYLGNCQKPKGVIDAYRALQGLDAHLVTSGKRRVKLPARNLELDYPDYVRLLKASSVVLSMSKFEEGWCRTAHEAMLLKRPVIGSGRGGMKELLEGGQQIVCGDFSSLTQEVEQLLNDEKLRQDMGERGYAFAKNFTEEKMTHAWSVFLKKFDEPDAQ